MTMPAVSQTLWNERAGIIAVAGQVNRLGLIWREQPLPDVGIDGQIELVDDKGHATGRIVAVQVKSGPSYLSGEGSAWHFHPDEKHRFYWEIFPIPVLLMLHSPAEGRTYWVDARQALRAASPETTGPIAIPRSNVLQRASATELFYTAGGAISPFLDLPDVLGTLCAARSTSESFCITHFDLFANGLTNLGNAVYFGMDLAMELAEAKMPAGEGWLTIGSDEHDFLFRYLRFLVEQNLADVNISNCLVDWHERGKQLTTIAPLTSRGRALVRLIHQEQLRFEAEGRLRVPPLLGVAQEDFVRMAFTLSHHARIPLITEFQALIQADHHHPTPASTD
jgi:hypothetical protein